MSIVSPAPSFTPQPSSVAPASQPPIENTSPLPPTSTNATSPQSSTVTSPSPTSTNAASPQSPPAPSTNVTSPPPTAPPPLPSLPPFTTSPPPPSLPPPLSPPHLPPTTHSPVLSPPHSQPQPNTPASSPPQPTLSPPHSQPQPNTPASSPPPPTLSPPHSPPQPTTRGSSHTSPSPLSPPLRDPEPPPSPPTTPGNSSHQPPFKVPSLSSPTANPHVKSPPPGPPQSTTPHSHTPASLAPTHSSPSTFPPKGSSLPIPDAQLSPPQSSNSAQPSLTPPSPSSPLPSSSTVPSNDSDAGIGTGWTAAIGVVLVLLLLGIVGAAALCLWRRARKNSGMAGDYILPVALDSPKSGSALLKVRESNTEIKNGFVSTIFNSPNPGGLGHSKPWFTYQELLEATNEFSEQNLLGEGGFGSVYKGCLTDGRDVAVKKLSIGGGQGEREFRAEVETISRVHHRHLVSLIGYCIYENIRLLVYEYVPNDTLYFHLHVQDRPVMDWAIRVKIAVGAARGIAYLHEDCYPRIIHRDIKSSNILLDNNFEALVSDFGLAKLAQDATSHVTTRVMGTFGYLAPEYASSGKLTEKSDVFSFGVVLLELITGRKPVDASQPLGEESLVEWARPLLSHTLENGQFDQLADPRLEKNYIDGELFRMIEVAAACVRHSAAKRPGMGQIMRAFDSMLMSDLTNGMKVGESAIFNSAERSAQIRLLERTAFASQDFSSDFSSQGNHKSRELSKHA